MMALQRAQQAWAETGIPGIQSCPMWSGDGGDGGYLARLSQGARFPKHVHDGWEQILVLSGAVRFNDLLLRHGDFLQVQGEDEHEAFAEEDSLIFVAHRGGIRVVE